MPEPSPSRTALGVAWLRAARQILDPPPRILEDPAALALFGSGAAVKLRSESERLQTPGALTPPRRTSIVSAIR